MSIARRLAMLFKAKANSALNRAEDPRQTLDYSYERQLEMLTKVRRGVADVATSRRRLELQLDQLRQATDRLQAQAGQAVRMGRDELARDALTRRASLLTQIGDLGPQRDSLRAEEDRLTLAAQRLQTKVESFRTRKETIKAGYTAAEAQTHISEAVSGISEEMGDVGMAMQRAEDKTAQMQARAQALDELIDSGALPDATLPSGHGDDIQAALDAAQDSGGVEGELAALKRQLAAPATRQALESADPAASHADDGAPHHEEEAQP